MRYKTIGLAALCLLIILTGNAQKTTNGKKISPDLFGLFFEDINYSADGGLYAELVQNRSFEYNPAERQEWNSFSYWNYITPGFSYGKISVETEAPLHTNNPHYLVLEAEHIGNEKSFAGLPGVGVKNNGFEGIPVHANERYNLSFFARQLSADPVSARLRLTDKKGNVLADSSVSISTKNWTKYTSALVPSITEDSAELSLLLTSKGKIAIDVISLFPQNTFKNRANGLRADLATKLADMKPKFIRFPGGCLTHGDGLGNMYRWENTIGPVEQRKEQRNIWGYHQTAGLGYFEYFQFCEDIGAKPLPVLPAAVSCQNSGGTWRVGGTGQQAVAMDDMQEYIQEVLNLVEWANGPATSEWGAKRAAAGHPQPFRLEYVGIGNEDKITPEFETRFRMIYDAVKAKYPEITVVGTVGPAPDGDDFTKGWKLAEQLKVPVVDEHYYTNPEWFISNQYRYDSYNRNSPQVYLGEYASWGNKLRNAIAEAVYMTALERNGDVVRMASYAPLFAKDKFTQWKTDMIFFDNKTVCLTPNYYVQKMFSANEGDAYFDNVVSKDNTDSMLAASCVRDSKTGDIIVKLVNAGSLPKNFEVNLSQFGKLVPAGEKIVLTGDADAENSLLHTNVIEPISSSFTGKKVFTYSAPSMSLTVIRMKGKKEKRS